MKAVRTPVRTPSDPSTTSLPAAAKNADPLSTAMATAFAPFIFANYASTYGFCEGVAHVTLEAARHLLPAHGPTLDLIAVAHLRLSLPGVRSLRAALESIELMAEPVHESQKN